ncbi:hypothetical protein RFY41_07255, partial [Acinetobacter soli]|uniref:hypothetical protein n=1 Tax=Acinetobacter soli TaxID=487316 RepID=UPI0028134778
LKDPKIRYNGPCSPWVDKEEAILEPENTIYQWFSSVDHVNNTTTIYAHFGNLTLEELKQHLIEINVRECCFAPSQVNTNYLTIQGFEFAHAATQWA